MVCVVSNLAVKQCMPFIAGRLPLILRQCDHALQQQNCCYNIVVLHLHLTEALTDCRVVVVSMLNICRVPISWNCKFKKILFYHPVDDFIPLLHPTYEKINILQFVEYVGQMTNLVTKSH